MSRLTIRQAYEEHYVSPELSKGTQSLMRTCCTVWEKLTNNPDITEITNATLAEFREKAIEAGLSPTYINTTWKNLRSILRRVGPVTEGNPWALELTPRVPAMRPVPVPFKRPRRLSDEELSRAYSAARHMTKPKRDTPQVAHWWRTLIVFIYFTGLRISDVRKATWKDITVKGDEWTLFVKVKKTGVEADLPLHPVLVEHLKRLKRTGEKLFKIDGRQLHRLWGELREMAGVDFGFHDIRRTACSEIDRIDRGLGKVLLLHAPNSVTEKSYLNALDDLRPAIEKMMVPLAFKHGIKITERAVKKARVRLIDENDFVCPVVPGPGAFHFQGNGFFFRGKFHQQQGQALTILKTLADAAGPVSQQDLWKATDDRPFPTASAAARKRLYTRIVEAKQALRKHLKIPEEFNPIVPTMRCKKGDLAQYELLLPPDICRGEEKSA